MLKWIKRAALFCVLALFLFIGIFFAIRNGQVMTLDLVLWQGPELSIALYMILSFAVGAVLTLIASSLLLLRSDRCVRKQRKQLERQQSEIDNLRKASLSTELAERE
ncbi:LapA family protein [Marinomonas ostreistagni]|uniref:LapA family protein n=1 Tax=Marinomonas ostreistagni TaxID=359209 RepID=UPI001950586F|nr:LapA family protein [Marinomonas ostreistagni]MBM6551730.1 LapA family protein [Marinomonas ostreistagni]